MTWMLIAFFYFFIFFVSISVRLGVQNFTLHLLLQYTLRFE